MRPPTTPVLTDELALAAEDLDSLARRLSTLAGRLPPAGPDSIRRDDLLLAARVLRGQVKVLRRTAEGGAG